MAKDLKIGVQTNGIKHAHGDPMPDVDTRFRMVKESGAFDYVDKTPAPDEIDLFIAAREKYDLPVRAGGWFYTLGRDEGLMVENLKLAGRLGSIVHNVQVTSRKADGTLASDREVVDFYERAVAEGDRQAVDPCLEVHVNMWSEDFRRVEVVGRMAEDRGLPFRMTLDHSHVIFKIDNPKEQEVFDIRGDVEAGRLILDPFEARQCLPDLDRGRLGAALPCPCGGAEQSQKHRGRRRERQTRAGASNIRSAIPDRTTITLRGTGRCWSPGRRWCAN